ncbi:hypothetical protein EJB05_01950 [Eragrostis curvula]|uniref:Uncharacterized protein n=1 Tax=Eragrostis curvula TaxID=38414 RepID=A0A5J9WQZ5_9POAL|nr:hypothetical protein EJB05_01950 [Eragrostis curvula]
MIYDVNSPLFRSFLSQKGGASDKRKMEEQKPKEQRPKANENKPSSSSPNENTEASAAIALNSLMLEDSTGGLKRTGEKVNALVFNGLLGSRKELSITNRKKRKSNARNLGKILWQGILDLTNAEEFSGSSPKRINQMLKTWMLVPPVLQHLLLEQQLVQK